MSGVGCWVVGVLRLWDSLLSDSRRFLQAAAYLLPYYPLLTTRYPLLATHYSLLTTHYHYPTHPLPNTQHPTPGTLPHYTYCYTYCL